MNINLQTGGHIRMTEHLAGQLSIYTARGDILHDNRVQQPIEDGLKLVVSSVAMKLCASGVESFESTEPIAFAVLSNGEHDRDQIFFKGKKRWDIALSLDRQLVMNEFGEEPEELLSQSKQQSLTIRTMQADSVMQAQALQLLSLPNKPFNNMTRLGSGLSLAATILGRFSKSHERVHKRLKQTDIERVVHARELLISDLANAPDIRTLAHMTGTNTSKFNRDFLIVTGMTPHAWLQEQRLCEAWRMLSENSVSVSEVAYASGYTPAHFSTLFRKRFKISPRYIANGNV